MSETAKTPPHIRRVVTGHDTNGKACVWLDSDLTNHKSPDEKTSSSMVWSTESTPADFTGIEDMGLRMLGTAPPAGGTRFAVLEIEPGNKLHGMHRTDTLDYVICLSGEITMLLDDSQVTLKPGEILIQRGTNHAWINQGAETARFACILIDGAPKRSGSVSGAGQAR
jgi:quercetin dioxygenase-like cupin family protein